MTVLGSTSQHMRKPCIIIILTFISISFSLYGQSISMGKQKYYVWNDRMDIDTICNLIYKVKNVSSNLLVVMFTEDDIRSMPLNKLIKRKMYQRYGDFSFSQFVWDNIENHSEAPLVPDCFIKILAPNESIDITLLLQNEDDSFVDSQFRNHILVFNIEDIDNKDMFYGFKDAVNEHHLAYSSSSITMLWSRFTDWLQIRNLQRRKKTQ